MSKLVEERGPSLKLSFLLITLCKRLIVNFLRTVLFLFFFIYAEFYAHKMPSFMVLFIGIQRLGSLSQPLQCVHPQFSA